MPKPNFFIVGAPKCGTTAMKHYLVQHPDVFMARPKEINYFIRDVDIGPRKTEDWYLNHFKDAGDARIIGEKSVWHLFSSTAAAAIKAFNADARILIMLRDPVDLIHSLHSQFLYARNEDIRDFAEALAAEHERRQGRRIPEYAYNKPALIYRDTAKYTDQVARYFDVFGRDAVRVVIYDDFKADTEAEVRAVFEFLEIDASFRPEIEVVNANKKLRSLFLRDLVNQPPDGLRALARALFPTSARKRVKAWLRAWNVQDKARASLDPDLRARLDEEFAPEVERLGALLGRDLSRWCPLKPEPEAGAPAKPALTQRIAH